MTETYYIAVAISIIGGGSLFGVFYTKKPGFGVQTLRAVGLVLIATLASLLAVCSTEYVTSAIGILGAIAGYLFGINDDHT